MRILLDESLPRPFARLLPEHDVCTVAAMGSAGKQNGELLQLAGAEFDALLTADQNLEHQQKPLQKNLWVLSGSGSLPRV